MAAAGSNGRHLDGGDDLFARSNLTRMQFLIWMGQKLNPDAPLYNMIQTFAFDGALDPERFARAFQAVVDGTDALRTVVEEVEGAPRARVLSGLPYRVEHINLSAADDPQAAWAQWLDRRRLQMFDLGQRLFDSTLVQLAPDKFIWFLCHHHLITDGFSFLVVYKRTADMYERLGAGDSPSPPAWPQFADYAGHERVFRDTAAFEKAEAYWREKTAPAEPLAFFDRLPAARTARTERVVCDLGPERSARLRALAAEKDLRAFSLDLALYNLFVTLTAAYLHRATGAARLAIGTPFHNRPTPAFKDTVGVFIEIGPLVLEVDQADTFATLHKKVAGEVQRALLHARPGISRAERNRAYEVLLNYVNVQFPPFAGLAPAVEWVHAGYGDATHSLRLQIADFGATGNFAAHFDFNHGAFDAQQRAWAVEQFLRVVDAFIEDRARGLNDFSLQTEREAQALVVDYNRSAAIYPSDRTVIDLFEAQVERTPQAEAIRFGDASLSYRQLNARANQMAAHLRELGVQPDQLVVLYMEHSLEVVAALLGALKAGAAYVPVDPAYPRERLAFMLKDIEAGLGGAAPVLVTQSRLAEAVPPGARVVTLDNFAPIDSASAENLNLPVSPRALAYVIYTSGSTGQPKGVMIEHRSLVNYIWWARAQYCRDEPLSWPLFSSLSFDLTVTSIFTPLLSGGRIVVYREDPGARGTVIFQVVEDDAVDIVKLTPAHLALIKDLELGPTRIRRFIVGGEDFKTELARDIAAAFGRPVAMYNEYGPTEATVGCMIHRFDPERDRAPSVPIGLPAANAQIYVLDRHLNPAPPGVIGEMYLAGDGLARGYFNRPDLTAEKFIEPGSQRDTPLGRLRLYRTGDIARWTADGRMEFLGRADHQVKLGGYRIELGEIEARLLAHPAIRECVVDVVGAAAAQEAEVRHCARCGLESNFPDVSYDADGVCNLCRAFDGYRDKAAAYFRPMDELRALAAKMKAAARGGADCVVLVSGGKDSTYMLYQLVGLGLRPVVFTLDNGFISDEAKANIRRVVQALGVEHVFGQTPHMNEIFVDSLKRYANVCNGCFKTIYTLATNLARERGIGYVVTGLSRGQFFETRLTEDLFQLEGFDPGDIDRMIVEARRAYHGRDDVISRSLDVDAFRDENVFDDVQFVDFYRYWDVPLDEVYAFLTNHAPWIRPSDTGRSTNCLINDAGIYVHKRRRGYHNYALPYSWDVRLGHKTREAALEELNDDIDEAQVKSMLAQIGFSEGAPAEAGARRLAAYYAADRPLTSADLRAFLGQSLPEYMIPSFFVALDKLPLTQNGKVDRQALPHPEAERPELATGYLAPRTPAETALAQAWAAVLRLDRVGIHDNFFELGGDSIMNIQIVARAGQAGWKITPNQLFRHQTIAELARVAEPAEAARASHEPELGPAPLTPVQRWFFEQAFAEPHHWNQWLQVELRRRVELQPLEAAFAALIEHHDALRLAFRQEGGEWRQVVNASAPGPFVEQIDLSSVPATEQGRALEAAAASLNTGLDIEHGRLARAALVDVGGGRPQRLVIAIHHLAVDGVSWWILLNDLETAYEHAARGERARLPRTTAFKRWAGLLADYARSPKLAAQSYWQKRAPAQTPLPADAAAGPEANTEAAARTASIRLSPEETQALLRDVHAAYHTQINDVLLAALAHTFARWTSAPSIDLHLEGHGREDVIAGADLSRTVGWFTTFYPVTLTAASGPAETLRATKESLRAIPNHGFEYGVRRYLAGDPAESEPPVLFNYLGQFDSLVAGSKLFARSGELRLARSPRSRRPYLLEINAYVGEGRLHVDWKYCPAMHRPETIEALAQAYAADLRRLIAHCAAVGRPGYTPSDFPEADVSQQELDDILTEFAE